MSRDYNLFLGDIRQSCQRILRYTSGLTKDDFVADEKTYDAVLRQLIIVGEAVKNLPQDVRDLYPGVEWRQIGRFRDFAVHHYFGIDDKIVWNIVANEIPSLLAALGLSEQV